MFVLQVLFAYILADLISGIYHVLTDRGFNIPSQVLIFQKHHVKPHTLTFDLSPFLGSIPLFIIAYFVWPVFFTSLGLFIGIVQLTHYYTHHPAPRWIKWLQKSKIILSEKQHDTHHSNYDINFCILSGWNNWWFNKVIGLIDKHGKTLDPKNLD